MNHVKQRKLPHELTCSQEFLALTQSRQAAHRILLDDELPCHLSGMSKGASSSQGAEEQQEDVALPLTQSFESPSLSTIDQTAFQQSH